MRYLDKSELDQLLQAKSLIPFMENTPDSDVEGMLWFIYGHPAKNEIVVALIRGPESLIAAVPSPVLYPRMAERIFGLDMDDMRVAEELSHAIFAEYQKRAGGVVDL